MAELDEIRRALDETRHARDDFRVAHRQRLFDLRVLEDEIALVRRSATIDEDAAARLKQLEAEREELTGAVRDAGEAVAGASKRARDRTIELLDIDPQTLIEQLADDAPILLMPVRIETRFAGSGAGRALLVRIFPDDVAIAQHERMLTASEAADGQAYWRDRCRANAEPDPTIRTGLERGAWTLIATRHAAYRASWIVRETRPTNWSDTLADPAAAVFRTLETKPLSWSEAPRSFVLPDRFVVRLMAGGISREVPCRPIPDDLPFGPDPLQAEEHMTRDEATGRLVIHESLRWLLEFDKAVEVGMAVRIPLELPREALGFDLVSVIGMRFATGSEENVGLIERLFEAHRFSHGVSVVPQGTPTNNTDGHRSGLSTGVESIDETFVLEQATDGLVEETDHFLKTDGQRLAEALGIPLDAVRPLPAATGRDVTEALAMNRALWSATLGEFFHDHLSPLVTVPTIDRIQRFFGAYVAGRGMLPAIRFGNQPYGVLTTSTLRSWEWSERELGDDTPLGRDLLVRLRALSSRWGGLASEVSYIGKPGDPFDNLLSVMGLQASSVEFYSRKAVARDYLANYLGFLGTLGLGRKLWLDSQRQATDDLDRLGLDVPVQFRLRDLVFWRRHERLTGPVIDGDPGTPLAEDRAIRDFRTDINYVDWLRISSRDDILRQAFTGDDGQPIPPPQALLYKLLRHAFLAELARAGRTLVVDRVPAVFAELSPEPSIANVGAARTFGDRDVLNVDASRIGLTAGRATVGDVLVDDARRPGGPTPGLPSIGLAGWHSALEVLAPLPTARLERLFAEHLDLCGYRLDAWIQGMFALRLDRLRGEQRTPTIHLGAYGRVEDVRPAQGVRRAVPVEEIPEPLRSDDVGPVTEDETNGGYVHAPSLTHAVTAAVLRNAYLSHAEPSRADAMAVNLSSSRVRTALAYLDGVRSGQELASLLGYELERGLHENHPGVELDEFIYVLRARFPFTSNKLTGVPDGTPSEVIEARNVVNGYDLLDHIRGREYPFGIDGLPRDDAASTATQRAQAAALRLEIDGLADAMDSIADVLLSESVHQIIQGNVDRARGALQAINEGEAAAADLHVVETPRSGRSLGFRVALPLDPTRTNGWGPTPTPRSIANAALNHWLATVLPASSDIECQLVEGANQPIFVSLSTLGIEAIDGVLMAGERLGDMSGDLERYLVYAFREANGVADETPVVIDANVASAGKQALGAILPLLKALRRLITGGRPLDARDFEMPIESQEIEPADPRGFDDGSANLLELSDLKGRLEVAHADLISARNGLEGFLSATINPLYDALLADPDHVVVAQWSNDLPTLRDRMVALFRFGVGEALPSGGLDLTKVVIDATVAQARSVVRIVDRRLTDARDALDITFPEPLPPDPAEADRQRAFRTQTRLERYTEAGRLVLGGAFTALPLFKVHAASRAELAAAVAAPPVTDPLEIEQWLRSVARVRQPLDAIGLVSSYAEWIGSPPIEPIPIQLPVRAGDPWIGGAIGGLTPGETVSVVLMRPMTPPGQELCGLLLDEWTELVPTEEETTGLAFHFDRPNAVAPQVLLLAVAPVLRGGWRWADLTAVIDETFERARARAIEPDMIAATEYFQVLPAILHEFSSAGHKSTLHALNSVSTSIELARKG